MKDRPNKILLTCIQNNEHSPERLINQKRMVEMAISAWSIGGNCYDENKHIAGYCEEQRGYFYEALNLINNLLVKFN